MINEPYDLYPTEEIGERLRRAREAQHISLRGAARRLRIHERYLQALEDEDFQALPPGSYTLGFLRNYAQFLGLEFDEIRRLYVRDHGDVPVVKQVALPKDTRKPPRFVFTPAKVIGFSSVVVTFVLLWYLFRQYQKLIQPPILELYVPEQGAVYQEKNIAVVGKTDPDAVLTINGEEIDLSQSGEFQQDFIAFRNGTETIELVAENRISKKETILQRTFRVDLPATEVLTKDETEPDAASTPVSNLQLRLRVVDKVWFSVSIDRGSSEEFILEEGQEKILQADQEIFVWCGNAYATYVSLNNGAEEIFGNTSVIKRTWTSKKT